MKTIIYNRRQFKPIADDLIALCAKNATQASIFNEEDLITIVRVEQIFGAFRVWLEKGCLHINQFAFDYIQRRAARFSVPLFTE